MLLAMSPKDEEMSDPLAIGGAVAGFGSAIAAFAKAFFDTKELRAELREQKENHTAILRRMNDEFSMRHKILEDEYKQRYDELAHRNDECEGTSLRQSRKIMELEAQNSAQAADMSRIQNSLDTLIKVVGRSINV